MYSNTNGKAEIITNPHINFFVITSIRELFRVGDIGLRYFSWSDRIYLLSRLSHLYISFHAYSQPPKISSSVLNPRQPNCFYEPCVEEFIETLARGTSFD